MPSFPLQLTHREHQDLGSPNGWLLPGTDVGQWIRLLCASGMRNPDDQPLFVIPASTDDLSPGGLFVPAALRQAPKQALAYTLHHQRVFLPWNAAFKHPLLEDEYATLFLQDVNLVHPQLGHIGFELSEALYLQDLVALPPIDDTPWNRAHPGLPPIAETLAIAAQAPPKDLEGMLAQSREDIGSSPPSEIPRGRPGKSKPGGQGKGGGGGSSGFVRAVKRFTKLFPESPNAKRNWINRLEDWAESQLQREQSEEVDRLLQLFEADPDQGLRYALPIGGDKGRGYTHPTTQLPERHVDFQLGKLGGGERISPWLLDHSQTQRLMQAYREAANRELQLGRHRRAAYIFAHLLSDYSSAANALKTGGYHREAAAIYQERLQNKQAAALCLREGGAFEEALQLYEELGEHETIAAIYLELGQLEQATDAYEHAVTYLVSERKDPLRAARILEEQLLQPDRAATLLLDHWQAPRARDCLNAYFLLQNRLGDYETATLTAQDLAARASSPQDYLTVAKALAQASEALAQSTFQETARDGARVVLGRFLAGPERDEAQQREAMKTLRSLDATDQLLRKDTKRYAQTLERSKKPLSSPHLLERSVRLTLVATVPFRSGVSMVSAVPFRSGFLAMGAIQRKPIIYGHHLQQTYNCHYLCSEEAPPPWPWQPVQIIPAPQKRGTLPRKIHILTQQAIPCHRLTREEGSSPPIELSFQMTGAETL